MEDRKLTYLENVNPGVTNLIAGWIDKDIQLLLDYSKIKPEEVPKKREELLKEYVNLFYSLS